MRDLIATVIGYIIVGVFGIILLVLAYGLINSVWNNLPVLAVIAVVAVIIILWNE